MSQTLLSRVHCASWATAYRLQARETNEARHTAHAIAQFSLKPSQLLGGPLLLSVIFDTPFGKWWCVLQLFRAPRGRIQPLSQMRQDVQAHDRKWLEGLPRKQGPRSLETITETISFRNGNRTRALWKSTRVLLPSRNGHWTSSKGNRCNSGCTAVVVRCDCPTDGVVVLFCAGRHPQQLYILWCIPEAGP